MYNCTILSCRENNEKGNVIYNCIPHCWSGDTITCLEEREEKEVLEENEEEKEGTLT